MAINDHGTAQESLLTVDYLRARLHYDPETGLFTWKPKSPVTRYDRAWNTRYSGAEAGTQHSGGYIQINIDGVFYFAHRLAIFYMTGEWPPKDTDHHDTNGLNNRWENLRPATRSQNKANTHPPANNTSGFKGVSWHKPTNRWRARICVQGTSRHLGLFDTIEAACNAYADAARADFGKFARAALPLT